MANIKRLETYGFAEADLLSRKTKLKIYRRSMCPEQSRMGSLREKLNALSNKPFEKWLRQSPTRVNSCPFVVNSSCISVFVAEKSFNQKRAIMQNEPNFMKNNVNINHDKSKRYKNAPPIFSPKIPNPISLSVQMNLTPYKSMNYEQITMNFLGKNEPKRTQFKPNFTPIVSISDSNFRLGMLYGENYVL